jgi:hypothetical protein
MPKQRLTSKKYDSVWEVEIPLKMIRNIAKAAGVYERHLNFNLELPGAHINAVANVRKAIVDFAHEHAEQLLREKNVRRAKKRKLTNKNYDSIWVVDIPLSAMRDIAKAAGVDVSSLCYNQDPNHTRAATRICKEIVRLAHERAQQLVCYPKEIQRNESEPSIPRALDEDEDP